MDLLLASNNPGKLAELRRIVDSSGLNIRVLALSDVVAYDEPLETGRTFQENALIKAHAGFAATGIATLADDSGLSIGELNGMPGVRSARWAGTHGDDKANNALVLSQLADVEMERREAAFISVCALVTADQELVAEGSWEGHIGYEEVGENGFGYDPIFLPADAPGRTSAQLTSDEKDARSHRGRALSQLVEAMQQAGIAQ